MSLRNKNSRVIDQVGKSAYQTINRKYSLVHKKQVATWKAYSIIAFVAGLTAASIWFTSYRIGQDQIVINTKPFSMAKSNETPNKGGIVGRADDHILVKFKKDISLDKRQAILNKHGLKEKSEIKQIGVRVVTLPTGQTPEQAVKKMLDEDKANVEFVEVDALTAPDYTPNDPSLSSEWHIAKIGAPAAWDNGKGAGVTIAVLDTGTDCTHPDLAANCVAGWNVVSNNNDTSPIHPHGTYTAGTAAAVGDNAAQMAGVAYASKIMPVRITNDSTGYAYWSNIANGVIWAADHGAKVVTNSYASHLGSSVQSAASYLNSKGGIMFNSAGNDSLLQTDANPTSMVTISATDSNDTRASWSNYGTTVDLAAPGVSVMCTVPGGGISFCSGTSFSSPTAAGVAALVMSAKPGLSPSQVENILKSTAKDLGAAGRDDYYGYGRVDAAAAVAAALGTSTPTPDTTAPTAPTNLTASPTNTGITLNWTAATDNVGVTQYRIYRDGAQTGTSTTTNYTDTTVTPQNTYTYLVKAADAAGNVSSASNSVTATAPATPLAISNIVAKVTSSTTTTITWNTSAPVASSVLQYGTSPTSLGLSATISDTTTTHTANLSGLSQKTRYYYRITVTGLKGEVVTSDIQNFTTRPK